MIILTLKINVYKKYIINTKYNHIWEKEEKMADISLSPPYYGGEYSPELTGLSEIDFDIAMMEKSGFNVVRIGNGCWNIIERSKGLFDFSFYHAILKKLSKKNIGVIFSLPIFSPPIWLWAEIGKRGREKAICLSDIEYINFSFYMVKKVIEAFDGYNNILYWETAFPESDDCFCEECRKKFASFLSNKYKGSIERLNFTLNNSAEDVVYSSFEELSEDERGLRLNPHLLIEWRKFRAEESRAFLKTLKGIIKENSKKPFGASFFYDTQNLDKFVSEVDIPSVSYDYCKRDKYFSFFMSYFSTLKLKRYFSCPAFDSCKDYPIERKEKNYHRFRIFFPYLTGAQGNIYWFFRNHHCGSKTECDALLSSEGRPTIHCEEAFRAGKDLEKAADFLNNTRAFPSAALLYSSFSKYFFKIQRNFMISDYDSLIVENFYEPIKRKGIELDIIGGNSDLSGYKILFTPMAVSLEDSLSVKKIENWVREGGIWICGPLSDIRDSDGIKYKRSPFGSIESLTNAYLYHRVYSRKPMNAVWSDGKSFDGFLWYDIFEPSDNDLVVMSDEYKEFSGKSLVRISSLGKGKIILLGTFPSFSDMEKIVDVALSFVKISRLRCSENVWFSSRRGYDDFGREYKGLVLAEYKGKDGSVRLQNAYLDLFSGKMLKGIIKIEPYGVYVLEEVSEK